MLFVDNPRGTGFSYSIPGTLCTEWRCVLPAARSGPAHY